jgi:hypothetical protein
MGLWERVKGWVTSNAEHLVWTPVGEQQDGLTPHDSYFRLWLSQAFLARDKEFFKTHHPAVHTSVRLNFGGEAGQTITSLSRPPEGELGPGAYGNYELTSLLPYRGGTVGVQAGLTVLEGDSPLAAAFGVVQAFSGLVAPPLSEALTIAEKVAGGVDKLLDAGKDDVTLGLHQQFAAPGGGGDNVLRPGYWALVKATEEEVPPAKLLVEQDRLRISDGGGGSEALTGYDYLLLRIEGRKERDDWRFKRYEDQIANAIRAHFEDNEPAFKNYRSGLLADVLSSNDLTETDQRRVAVAIKRQLDEAVSAGLGATGDGPPNLDDIMELRAPTPDEVAGMGETTVDDVLRTG